MRLLIASAALLLCSLSSCYTRHTEPREPFVITGIVTACTTGKPIEGVEIYLRAYADNGMGPFGTFSAEGGKAVTDADGKFAVLPYEYTSTESFTIIASREGFKNKSMSIDKAAVIASGAKTFQVDDLCLQH